MIFNYICLSVFYVFRKFVSMTVADELQFKIALCIRNGAHARSGSWYASSNIQSLLVTQQIQTQQCISKDIVCLAPPLWLRNPRKNPCQSCIRRRRIIRPQSISRLLFHNLSQLKCVFQNCTDCYTALLSTEGVSAFPGFLIFENFSAIVYLFNYHIMNKYLGYRKHVIQFM